MFIFCWQMKWMMKDMDWTEYILDQYTIHIAAERSSGNTGIIHSTINLYINIYNEIEVATESCSGKKQRKEAAKRSSGKKQRKEAAKRSSGKKQRKEAEQSGSPSCCQNLHHPIEYHQQWIWLQRYHLQWWGWIHQKYHHQDWRWGHYVHHQPNKLKEI